MDAGSGAVLEVKNVSRTYLTGKGVRDVSFSLEGGRVVALVGPNGAGKTTLLEVLAAQAAPDEGLVTLMGVPLAEERRYKQLLAYLPELRGYPPYLPPRIAVGLAAEFWLQREVRERFEREADRLGFDSSSLDLPIRTLSQGNREKLSLALVFSRKADLYLLDEPEAHLDAIVRERLEARIRDLADEAAVLFSTHDVHMAARLADQVLVIKSGRTAFLGRERDGRAILAALREMEAEDA